MARSNRIVLRLRTSNQLRHYRVDTRLGLHQAAQRARRPVPHGQTARVRRRLDERALQLREERLHERRDRVQHRRQRAQNRALHAWRVRRRLRGDADQRARELHDVRLERALFRARHEVADRVCRVLALLVAARRQARDDDRHHGGDSFWQAETRHMAPRRACRLDCPSKRDNQGLELVLRYGFDKGIKGLPCCCVYDHFRIVHQGNKLSDPVDTIERIIQAALFAEGAEQFAGTCTSCGVS